MTEENISQGFKLREIDGIRNFLLGKINIFIWKVRSTKKGL